MPNRVTDLTQNKPSTPEEVSAELGSDGWRPILASQLEFQGGDRPAIWDDAAAASLVRQDYERARGYIDNQMWQAQWEESDILYQSPYLSSGSYDDGGGRFARVSRFGVNNATNTMADAVKAGLFAQKPPVFLRPRGKTTQPLCDAWGALLDVLFDRMGFRYWAGLGIESQTLQGTGIWKGGWSTRTKKIRRRKRKVLPPAPEMPVGGAKPIQTKESNELVDDTKEKVQSYPWLEYRMLGTTIFDPAWRTPNRPDLCGFVVDIDYPTWYELKVLRNEDCYKIPTDETLKKYFFDKVDVAPPTGTQLEQIQSDAGSAVMHAEERSRATSADPLMGRIMMLERTTAENVMTTLTMNGRELCIRNDENDLGRIPHFSANWRNVPNSGYGIGTGKLAGGDQRLEQGTLNHAINLLAYQLSPAILIAMGVNAPTQNREVRAGGFFEVQPPADGDVRKAMAVMQMPEVPAQAWQMIQYAKESSEDTVGNDSTFMQGQLGGKGSSAARTATGAGAISAKANGRVQTPVENIEMGLIVPYTYMLIDMVKMKMPLDEIEEILTDKLGKAVVDAIVMDDFLGAEMDIEALAGAKLAAKAAMAAQLPYLMQIFQQPQILEQLHAEGKTVDLQVILDVLFQVSEFRNEKDIIRNMTDDEKKQVAQANPAQAKTQAELAVEQQKGQNQLALSDKNAENDVGKELALKAADRISEAQGGGGKEGKESPLDRATGLVQRGGDEKVLQGQSEPVLAGA
jgi:hypothetical protein